MYISQLSIQGYKNAYNKCTIDFNEGLNVLLGENGCGKTAIINALRFAFKEQESFYAFSADDFFCSHDKMRMSSSVEIDVRLSKLDDEEQLTFLTWCDADFNGQLHLQITENALKPGQVKKRWWGGESSASVFEEDTFDRIECVYLPPLRDAEARLTSGRYSRLAMLLKKQYGKNQDKLVNAVRDFNRSIVQNGDGKQAEIDTAKKTINNKIRESLGEQLGQSISLQFSETTFNRIVENIRMVFFPHIGETDIDKFRDLATNSLGYNNLLYIATVLSELELIKESDVFKLLLIEEPEAHLHPQLQVKFIKYLEVLSSTLPNAQIVISTHSPVLASSVSLRKLIHISGSEDSISATTLSERVFTSSVCKNENNTRNNDNSVDYTELFINRWLDVTKSTMLFSRGIIFVEGISECLVLPKLAEIILKRWNKSHDCSRMPETLDEMGISVININGIHFHHFMKLFGNFQGTTGPVIPIPCAGITDRDPKKEVFPLKGTTPESNNPIVGVMDEINNDGNIWTRLFMSPYKTFEYDLAIYNPVALAQTLKKCWPTDGGTKGVKGQLDDIISRNGSYSNAAQEAEDAQYIYEHIDSGEVGKGLFSSILSEDIADDFTIPVYIENAVLWVCRRNQVEPSD